MEEKLTAVQKIIDTVIEFFVNYSFQIIGAIIVLVIGGLIARWTGDLVLKLSQKKKMDITLSKFLAGLVRILVFTFALIIALGKLGITIAPFIAALSALAFGASLAVQGPLSNYGAGLTIILTRPFAVGDTITVANVSGVVEDIQLARTVLTDEDGVKITIPSKDVVGQILYNSQQRKVVEGVVGISYSSNAEHAIETIWKTLQKFPEVVQNPKPQIGIQEFADSSVNIGYRYWVPTVKYFQTVYAVNLAVYKALQAVGDVSIPFPQREIRILSKSANAPAAPTLSHSQ